MNDSVKQTTTFYDRKTGECTVREASLKLTDECSLNKQIEENIVGLYPSYQFQTVEGFGCAMTESACYLLMQMGEQEREAALRCWFGPDGVNARFVRLSIDSCDYSLSEYQAVADPLRDPELETFSIERDRKYVLPVMREVQKLCGKTLSVLLSPWSPPAQWKTPPELTQNDLAVYGGLMGSIDFSRPGRCFGGRLKPEYYGAWAKYLVKYVQAYLAEGIPVTMLSVQNEAGAATNWDSCLWSAAQEKDFLQNHLYPRMLAAGLTEKVGLYIWDHNKERMVERIDAIMDDNTSAMVEGFAYHWYTGDHFDALSLLGQKYPGKVLMHSESCGLHIPGKALAFEVPEEMIGNLPPEMQQQMRKDPLEIDYADAVHYAHDMIGDLNHGMQRWIDWNMLVDRHGGPRHVMGGFAAPLVAEADGSVTKTVSYAYIKQIANTICPGCVRIGVSCCDSSLDVTAAIAPDGGLRVLLLNHDESARNIVVRVAGYLCQVQLPPLTLTTLELAQD